MLVDLSLSLGLSGHEIRLFLLLGALAGSDNIVRLSGAEIARMSGISREQIQRTFKDLESKGLICKVPAQGRVMYRMVNPEFVVKCGESMTKLVQRRWDHELKSERNALTREGVKWMVEHLLPNRERMLFLSRSRDEAHPSFAG